MTPTVLTVTFLRRLHGLQGLRGALMGRECRRCTGTAGSAHPEQFAHHDWGAMPGRGQLGPL